MKYTALTLAAGAAYLYLNDPEKGRRRRAMLRDQAESLLTQLDDVLEAAVRDLENRVQGALHEFGRSADENVPDEVVHERVRSKMGRYVRSARKIQVDVDRGHITLSGSVGEHEHEGLLRALSRVPGVRSIDDRLSPAAGAEYEPRDTRVVWPISTRAAAGAGGAMLIGWGVARSGIVGTAAAGTGTILITRAITNKTVAELLSGRAFLTQPLTVKKTFNVDVAVDQVFEFWTRFEDFPQFMSHLNQVRRIDENLSHWTAAGPLGIPAEWDARITRLEPNRVIAWRSEPGSPIENSGVVTFNPGTSGGTQVEIVISYEPPAGALGHAVLKLLGHDPKSKLDEDLQRAKTLLELGKTTKEGREVYDVGSFPG